MKHFSFNKPDGLPSFTKGEDGIRLAQGVTMPLDYSVTVRNSNFLALGSSSAWFGWQNITPNGNDYIIHDPYGFHYEKCGAMLKEHGYNVKILRLDPRSCSSDSALYNPFRHVHNYADIQAMANTIAENCKGKEDPFFTAATRSLLTTVFTYLYETEDECDRTMAKAAALVEAAVPDKLSGESNFARMVDSLKIAKPENATATHFLSLSHVLGKTMNTICSTTLDKLKLFLLPPYDRILVTDTLELNCYSGTPSAIFIETPARTFSPIAPLFFSQAIIEKKELYRSDKEYRHTIFVIPHIADLGYIPNLPTELAISGRHDKLSFILTENNLWSIKARYRDEWQTMFACCDTKVLFEGDFSDDLERINNLTAGATPITAINNTRHRERRYGSTVDISTLYADDCIVCIRGYRPTVCKTITTEC